MTSDSGEFKTDKACGHILMPKLLMMTVNAANRTTEQVSKVQSEIANGFQGLSQLRLIKNTRLEEYNGS